jgi:glycosyltransferase involved in cell wall biosynthesis
MKLLFLGLGTKDAMYEMYVRYCNLFSKVIDLYCVTNEKPVQEETKAIRTLNIKLSRSEPLSYLSLKKVSQIKHFIREVNPDIVYIFTCSPLNIFLMPFLKRYPIVTQIHDPIPHSGTSLLNRILFFIQKKQFYRYSKKIVVAGENLKKTIDKDCSACKSKTVVIHFPLLYVDPMNINVCKQTGKYSSDLLFFGRNEYYKGLDILADALKIAKTKPSLTIICKGSFQKAYKKALNFPSNTKIINSYISGKDLANYISHSKICVFPYRDATGTSTVGQSFQFGTPVIASNVGTFSEYIGDSGVLVPPENAKALADAIDLLCGNESIREEYCNRAVMRCKNFFSDSCFITDYLNLFSNILSL